MSTRRQTFDWTRAVMRDEALSGAAKTVAWCLAEHASTNAVAWPKVETIGADVAMHGANVRKHLHALRDAGYLVIEDRRHLREASWYWLALEHTSLGDLTMPPRPRGGAQSKLDGERVDIIERPRETARSKQGDLSTCVSAIVESSRPRETAQSSESAEPRGRSESRLRGSVDLDCAVPFTSTARIRAVPSKEDPPNDPPIEREERAPGPMLAKSNPDARGFGMLPQPSPNRAARIREFADAYGAAFKAALDQVWLASSALDAIERGAPRLPHRPIAEHLDAIVEWLDDQPDHETARAAVLRGAFADRWMRTHDYPLASIAKEPGRFAAPPKREPPPDELAGAKPDVAFREAEQRSRDLERSKELWAEPEVDIVAQLRGGAARAM